MNEHAYITAYQLYYVLTKSHNNAYVVRYQELTSAAYLSFSVARRRMDCFI